MRLSLLIILSLFLLGNLSYAETCIECHQKLQPNIVSDWQLSKHSENDVDCATCHEQPHAEGLHKKFPDCLKCHIDPHDLADWGGAPVEKVEAPGLELTEPVVEPAAAAPAPSEAVQ